MFKALGALFVGMQAVDWLLTMLAVKYAGCVEANPLMSAYTQTWVSPMVKVLPALLVVLMLRTSFVQRSGAFRTTATAGMACGIAFMLWVTALNVVELLK